MMLSHDEQPIIAQCTPRGTGALAVLRVSGMGADTLVSSISKLPSGKQLDTVQSHTIHYGMVVDAKGTIIDQVLFFVMRAPKTFTGQDTIEISCHNNQFIIEAIIEAALNVGARLAQEGEFTKRAVLNKKIDLIQAEAINDLIHANNQQTLKLSLAQLQGSLSSLLYQIEAQLIQAIALCEASFEFLDEENLSFGSAIVDIITSLLETIDTIKKSFDQQQQLRNGIRIALIGSVNTGKSSLFNALLAQDRAIVTDQAGTTRDVIEAGLYRNGHYWTLVDTAGLRQTDNQIEQEGIRRSHEEAHKADIILLVLDRARPILHEERTMYQDLYTKHAQKIIVLHNKADLPERMPALFPHAIETSIKDQESIARIRHAIQTIISTLFSSFSSPVLLNQRQFNLLLPLEKKLITLSALLKEPIQYELVSYHLHDAVMQLAELTGKTINDKMMQEVFTKFCVGK